MVSRSVMEVIFGIGVLVCTLPSSARAETPGPDKTSPADKLAIRETSIGDGNCQDRDNPCLIETNTTYSVHGMPGTNNFFKFRSETPGKCYVSRFQNA